MLLDVDAGWHADAALELRARGLTLPDRALAQELAFGALRWRGRVDGRLDGLLRHGLASLPPAARAVLEIAAYQLLHLDRIPARAAIHEAVEGVRALLPPSQSAGLTGVVNATLRRLDRDRTATDAPTSESAGELARATSHPQWLVERWTRRFGPERARAILQADNARPAVHLRAHADRTTAAELVDRLRSEGGDAGPHPLVEGCVVLHKRDPTAFAAFREGLFAVQDAGAQLVSRLAPVPEGGLVVDVCAAPGGKIGALAERPAGATFVAADVSSARLGRLRETAARMALPITAVAADARTLALGRPADLVIADVPCLGTGTFRRRADARWRKSPDDLPALVELQRAILDNAANLLAPRGRLVFATCSLEPEENEETVAWLVARRPDLAVLDVAAPDGGTLQLDGGGRALFVTPEQSDWDGAFAALLERR